MHHCSQGVFNSLRKHENPLAEITAAIVLIRVPAASRLRDASSHFPRETTHRQPIAPRKH